MNTPIQQLNKHLATLRAGFYPDLNPPLDDAAIEKLEAKYDVRLPADLKALYQWKNGQNVHTFDAFVNNSMFLPLEDALSTAAKFTSMIGTDFEVENWWHEKWIPVFHNGSGDYICYDMEGSFNGRPGQLIEFWHADNDRNIIAPSLDAFIRQINRFYETTPEFDEYFQIAPIEGYPKAFVLG